MNINRIVLAVRYDGSAYHGWQAQQDDLPTVQQILERALSRVADHPITLSCAGRTDAGVHATGQVVHFDTNADRSEYSWVFGANSNLPPDISVLWAKNAPIDFHARFSATGRKYRYIIYNYSVKPAILRHYVGWHHKHLDEARMQMAANYLFGEHDFNAFRGAGCQSQSSKRNVYDIRVTRQRRMVIIEVYANAFLLHMVRNIVGALIAVGAGEKAPEWIKEVLESGDRRKAGVTVTSSGLYLVKVDYPEKYDLPNNIPIGPFFLPE